jgi:tRNA pseudouridine55 synthase
MGSGTGRKQRGRQVNGILLLDKPVGISSNQALQSAKRLFDANKAGHTGNLDVLASGLLPVCFGQATKVCQFLLDADKHYRAEFTFGIRTTTGDAEGEIVSERSSAGLQASSIEAAMTTFSGVIEQIPPMYSALKRAGQPLYKLARQGLEVAREKRQVRIDHFSLHSFAAQQAVVDIRCSKGTYVRTLAEDLGEALGCGAFVSALRREGAGPYRIEQAFGLDVLGRILEEGEFAALDGLLMPIDSALQGLPQVQLSADRTHYVEQGQAVVVVHAPTEGLCRLYDDNKQFIGVGAFRDDGRVSLRRLLRTQTSESQQESMHHHA